jgi:fumarate reductase subunit D
MGGGIHRRGVGYSDESREVTEMAHRTSEPFLWTLFSAGGVVAAVLIPVHLVLFGFVFPLGLLQGPSYESMRELVHHPLTRVYLLIFCTLPLMHAAHRFRYTLYDGLQIKHLNELINPFCYGAAVVASIVAIWLLVTFP